MKILIDNGHGSNTPGKCSPDGRLKEYAYTREIAGRVVFELRKLGIDAELVVKEEVDVPLAERCRRVNEYKASEAILVSIHCNAAGNGTNWMNAKGWSVYVSNNASGNSKKLAECLSETVLSIGIPVRKPSPDKLYWQQNLAMCRDTNCPAVLTENFFQDNKEDVEFLLSARGKDAVAKIHIEGIAKYLGL
ncbi:N-acetylmuramoyl-L-alanine amidase [Bacteroides faecichinchillae]|uniref:N-acetylmuramoyl-L-alanine amidase n=1 Tax=Bacteroides faecichinchillae TaxID=871325 RepID=A0A1M5CEZ8_9BACE|nr:N-acetylmuramoyl-L-alanine amidase [Bacteroides faecichinchillae]SHF53323.1 N-acetylmuramoyl-L-alanine amidase [Bacteroides faecichinchillae]